MTIITISRFTSSGGAALADRISEKLGIPSISREVITQVANQFGMSEAFLSEQLETTKGPSSERRLYLASLQVALAEMALQGSFVYHGLAGHFLLRGIPQIVKVGIIAPMNQRAERLMHEKHISFEEAIKSIQRWDERRAKWVHFLYDVDWLDPSLYDLVINIANLSIESACELVVCAMNQTEFKGSPERQKLIEDFVLASRVKVQLAADERTKGLALEVEAKNGVVKVAGRVLLGGMFPWRGKERSQNDLIEVAKKVPGVQKVLVALEETVVALE